MRLAGMFRRITRIAQDRRKPAHRDVVDKRVEPKKQCHLPSKGGTPHAATMRRRGRPSRRRRTTAELRQPLFCWT
jgi:hypothetical protein